MATPFLYSSNTPFSALLQATQRGRYITFFTLVGNISRRQVIFHVGTRYFTLSGKSRNTREISDIFHFAAVHFLPERHSAMVLIYIYLFSNPAVLLGVFGTDNLPYSLD